MKHDTISMHKRSCGLGTVQNLMMKHFGHLTNNSLLELLTTLDNILTLNVIQRETFHPETAKQHKKIFHFTFSSCHSNTKQSLKWGDTRSLVTMLSSLLAV